MEGTTQTVMEQLWSNATVVVEKLIELLGTMSTALLGNEIFQIVIGIIVFGIGMGTVYSLVKKLKRRGR